MAGVTTMPIESFNGETFVAFLDICGFKEMMNTPRKAESALNSFFQVAYQEAERSEISQPVNCIAVSDSAIAFVGRDDLRTESGSKSLVDASRLISMLRFVRNVAKAMINGNVAINGSISYGHLEYQKKYEGARMVKAMLLGSAYLSALSDVEDGKPKLKPGQIRVKPKKKIEELINACSFDSSELSLLMSGAGGYYFYWMLDSMRDKSSFEGEFSSCYSRRYDETISVLKRYAQCRS